jgi:ribosomal protein S18 acetylase RimI-like enzyme
MGRVLSIRSATAADLDALVRLNRVVQSLHATLYPRDFKSDVDSSAVTEFFAGRLANPNMVIAIAETDNEPVGYVLFEIQLRPETTFSPARPRIYVHHVCVKHDERRQGVGKALFGHVEERAAKESIPEMALDSWIANSEAREFFAAMGFVVVNTALRKGLGTSN